MIFDLEEPWHWPLCSRKIGMPAQVAAVKRNHGQPDNIVVAGSRR
jgi:hypothetical protein